MVELRKESKISPILFPSIASIIRFGKSLHGKRYIGIKLSGKGCITLALGLN